MFATATSYYHIYIMRPLTACAAKPICRQRDNLTVRMRLEMHHRGLTIDIHLRRFVIHDLDIRRVRQLVRNIDVVRHIVFRTRWPQSSRSRVIGFSALCPYNTMLESVDARAVSGSSINLPWARSR